jgi:hypothetical protein
MEQEKSSVVELQKEIDAHSELMVAKKKQLAQCEKEYFKMFKEHKDMIKARDILQGKFKPLKGKFKDEKKPEPLIT